MKSRSGNPNFIILIIIGLLFLLLLIMATMLQILGDAENTNNSVNITVSTNTAKPSKNKKNAQDVIEAYGSKYIKLEKNIFIKNYVNFKYDLFDENGKSRKQYFYDMIEEIVEIEKESFYLIDNEKNIEIFVVYDKNKQTYSVRINNEEDYYEKTNGEIYADLQKSEVAKISDFSLSNNLLLRLTGNNMYYDGTELSSQDRVELENGYFSYNDGAMLARLKSGRVLNILFNEKYEQLIALDTYVNTSLEKVKEKYSNLAFGSISDGYLGYRTDDAYIFLYEDEVSVYGHQYSANTYFDTYLKDYCETGNLEKLYKDFTTDWTNYFENEYNPENQSLKISFPTRGIEIDIQNNDSTGIKIYNNYFLTETVEELIKANKITLIADKDLVHITEQARRENSR